MLITTSKDTHIAIRFNSEILDSILNDGRFKSIYESKRTGMISGTAGIGGIMQARLRIEHQLMSYPWSDEPWTLSYEERPIYGTLVSYQNPSEVVISSGRSAQYGDITAIMKHEVKSYATIAGADSANWQYYITPAPLLEPSRYIFNNCSSKTSVLPEAINLIRKSEPLSVSMFDAREYAEVQIHGGQATVSNIQHLIFGKDVQLRDDQAARLKFLGITWSREGEDIIH